MKTLVILILLAAVGYLTYQHYAPQELRDKSAAVASAIREGDSDAVRAVLGGVVLPEDPAERQEAVIRTLKETLAALRNEIEQTAPAVSGAATELLQRGDALIEELSRSGKTNSASGVVSRVLDRVFPRRSTAPACVSEDAS